MKNLNLFAVAFVVSISFSNELYAQTDDLKTEQATRSKGNTKNEVACVVKIVNTETGCDVVFNNEVKSPRDIATGQSSGKRQHKPISFNVNSSDNSVSEIKSPRDVATGQSSGKRSPGNPIKGISVKGGKNPGGNQFNSLFVNNGQINLPNDLPNGDYDLILSWSWGTSNSGSSKTYCSSHFILTIEDGACVAAKTK